MDAYVNYNGGLSTGATYRIAAGHGSYANADGNWGSPGTATGSWYGWRWGRTYSAERDATPVPRLNMAGQTPVPLAASRQPIIGDVWAPPGELIAIHGGHLYGTPAPVAPNHSHGANVGFLDGHVSWRNADQIDKNIEFHTAAKLWW
ncbi:H-X9-DG-CTERM domain-containing protein [Phycisphaerales bacterium AB-hyl4]|uniref:H-X9-DG-CTERM domain-containing protein n=1 Tax=Natronomicrosphaera hydrolytica TaxID=3242702 RepID=A0ABV4U3B9_9BACT